MKITKRKLQNPKKGKGKKNKYGRGNVAPKIEGPKINEKRATTPMRRNNAPMAIQIHLKGRKKKDANSFGTRLLWIGILSFPLLAESLEPFAEFL